MTPEKIIQLLDLEPLATEGGMFRQTFRSPTKVESEGRTRLASTAIYYLLHAGDFSAIHRVKSDELFHFYLGDPVEVFQWDEAGQKVRQILGPDLESGARPQLVVPGGRWQGSRLVKGGSWALVGCTVAPGFEYEDDAFLSRAELQAKYPNDRVLIGELTRV